MKPAVWMLTLLVLMPLPVLAGGNADKAACAAAKKQIREIEAKMRSGYTAAQGIRYEARLRKLKAERYKRCR